MANLSPIAFILIVVVCAVVALIVGYFLGSRFGGKKSVAMKEATEKHDSYKNDVREHFEQTSAIMSRMVDDYRDMYQHMADGAEKLAEMHPEKLVTPPPAPEAITRDTASGTPSTQTQAAQSKQGGDKSADNTADAKPAAADKRAGQHDTAVGTKPSEPAKPAEASGAQAKASDKAGAAGTQAKVDDKPGTAAKAESKTDARSKDAPNRDTVMNSDSSNDRPWNKENKGKDGKRYGLE